MSHLQFVSLHLGLLPAVGCFDSRAPHGSSVERIIENERIDVKRLSSFTRTIIIAAHD